MGVKLKLLNEDTIYEHIFERYSLLQKNSQSVNQDLGIESRINGYLELSFEPTDKKSACKDSFSFEVSQSLSSLNSSRDNNNSTTGYVVWSTTPFFLKWLLYSKSGEQFQKGASIACEDDPLKQFCDVEPIFSACESNHDDQPFRQIVELGSGVAGILGIALGNYVDKYVYTDQKALLARLEHNVAHNIDELRLRSLETLTLHVESCRRTPQKLQLDMLSLDWENFDPNPAKLHSLLLPARRAHVTIISMDVVYNEYLIEPYLRTLKGLLHAYRSKKHTVSALLGIQLRDQDVIETFLECAVRDFELNVHVIVDKMIEATRFDLFYVTLRD
ncbi:LADA_0G06216g1_1 [Lachancea dasiensis]|uniref:Ribosomal lysine N-methyltransferase 5 n=1 Tax=Lachancea dasiensis TaxID=1072105 RepID=A0A1G4JTE7_9SACH|nr:LADA_0G06216g1_1 [Lachancea dasiensis]